MADEAFVPSNSEPVLVLQSRKGRFERKDILSYSFLVLAPVLWAGNFIVGRAVHGQIPPLSLNAFRWILAIVILLPPFGRSAWNARMEFARRWKSIGLLALTGVVGFNSLLYLGLRHTTALSAAMIFSTTPLIILGLTNWLGRGRVSRWQIGAGALSVCGALIVLGGNIGQLGSALPNIGDIIVIAACFCWASYCVLIKTSQIEADPGAILLVAAVVGITVQVPLSVTEIAYLGLPHVSIGGVLAVGYLGIGAAALGFLVWQHAIHHLGPARSGVFLNLIPIFGVAMSVGILHEHLLWHHVIGGICIATGIAFAQLGLPQETVRELMNSKHV